MKLVQIDSTNIDLLYQFTMNRDEISPFFRYFEKRDPLFVVQKQHIYTIVGIDEISNKVIGYGHIDHENKYWLGICILNSYHGKGYGKQIMDGLINYADSKHILLSLSVDIENMNAIQMYTKYKFVEEKQTDTILYMIRYPTI
jgi:ribosomal protein S18 acetylase RimI-like enzyme